MTYRNGFNVHQILKQKRKKNGNGWNIKSGKTNGFSLRTKQK